MQTVKTITNPTFTVKITETNHSNSNRNAGVLLNKTLKPFKFLYHNGEKTHIVLKDVDGSAKFMVGLINGKLKLAGSEFIQCVQSKNGYVGTDWKQKNHVQCLKFTVNKL